MPERIIQVVTESAFKDELADISDKFGVVDYWKTSTGKGRICFHILVKAVNMQELVDKIQSKTASYPQTRIIISHVEASMARKDKKSQPEQAPEENSGGRTSGILREELYNDIAAGAKLDRDFLLIAFFSTIVAAIGLIENNVAVIVGAMVIAPLLGPNLAMALATALGDVDLMKKTLLANISGIIVCFIIALLIGYLFPIQTPINHELMQRTSVNFATIFLALASGAAAVLSLTKGVAATLVGVMVAVALLPPLTTSGIMLASGYDQHALSAFLLLVVNIVCINLSAKLTFLYKGVRPRTWYQKKKAGRASLWYLAFWLVSLSILAVIIYWRTQIPAAPATILIVPELSTPFG